MTVLLQDFRFAVRVLARSRGFAFLAILTVALGVGAGTTIFSLVSATLLRPPGGLDEPGELVQIGRENEGGFDSFAHPYVRAFDEQADLLEGVAAYSAETMFLGEGAGTDVITGELVTGNYFTVLGVRPLRGRTLTPDDARVPGAGAVAMISARLWEDRFGGDDDAVGSRLRVNGREYTVVGVADPAFRGVDIASSPADVWIPLSMSGAVLGQPDADYERPGWSWLRSVGRLESGASPEAAGAEIDSIYRQTYLDAWGERPERGVAIIRGVGLTPQERDLLATLTTLLMAVVGIVILVASANLGNLMLARATVRVREMGIRVALGASRGRLIRQLVTESVLLAVAGGAVALLATHWTARLIPSFLPWSLSVAFRPDLWVMAFALGCSILVGVLFGLVPALRTTGGDVTDALKEGARQISGGSHWLRRGLVAGQLALSFTLLVCAGLLVQSLSASQEADPGFRTEDILVARLDLNRSGYGEQEGRTIQARLAERARSLPGVRAAAIGANLPFAGWSRRSVMLPEPPPEGRPFVQIDTSTVGPGYFDTLGIPVLRGRAFPVAGPPPDADTVVLSRSAVETLFPDRDPLGASIELPAPPAPGSEEPRMISRRVVGIVADVQNRSLRQDPRPSMYLPSTGSYSGRTTIFLRVESRPTELAPAVRSMVAELDPRLTVLGVESLHDRMGSSLADTLLVGRLSGAFGALALLLAGVGLYGVVAYLTSRRTHEVGVRMALGASRKTVVRLVVRQGLSLGVAGLGIGLLVVLPATGLLRSLLYGVSPRDPVVLAGAATLLLAIAALASAVPARRATRVDPASALRDG